MIDVNVEAESMALNMQNWRIVIKNNKKLVLQKTIAAGSLFGDDGINTSENNDDKDEDNSTIFVFDVNTDIGNMEGKDAVVACATGSKTGEVLTYLD